MTRSFIQRAALAVGVVLGVLMTPAAAHAQKALVYCPVNVDATGCNAIVNALSPSFALGVDRGYDGTGGTVDLKAVDLFAYSVFVVPSLADDATSQPYAVLRDPEVVEHLKAALIGRIAMWSGTPDQGATNRGVKDALIQNLAGWAGGAFGTAKGPGLVALLDASANAGARYDWVRAITPVPVTSDANLLIYNSVRTLNPRGTTILTSGAGPIQYANMATFGFQVPNGAAGVSLDAVGQTGTSVGGQVVLVTMEAGNSTGALVKTDKDDYAPGTTVVITGSGWEPGETVKLTLHMDPLRDADTELTATADGSGKFTNTQFAPGDYDVGVRFVLTAVGQASGRRAQTTFTDGALKISSGTSGVTFDLTYTVYTSANCSTGGSSPLTENDVGFSGGDVFNLGVGNTQSVRLAAPAVSDQGGAFLNWTSAAPFTVISPGVICVAAFSGNREYVANYAAAAVNTTTSVASSLNPSVFGQSVTFTATVTATSGTPTGTVTFKDGATTLGTGTLSNVSGVQTATFATAALTAGSHSITAEYAGATGFNASTSAPLTQVVNKAAQTVAFTSIAPSSAVVGGPTYTVSATGGASGNPVTFASGTPLICSVTGTTVSMLAVGTCVINANQLGNSNYFDAAEATQSFSIGKGTATVTLANLTHTYDRTAKAATATTTPSGLTVSITYSQSGNPVTSPTNAGSYDVTATITDANYQGSTTGTLTIAQAVVTGSFTADNKVYDGTAAATILTRSLTGVIAPDVVTLDGGTATFADENAGNAKTVTGTGFTLGGAAAANYVLAASSITTTADITKRALGVTATGQDKQYDGTTAATVTLQDNRIAGDVLTASYTTATFADENVGTSKVVTVSGISITGTDAGNYTANTICTTTASITAKQITGNFTADNKVYDGTTAATILTRSLTGAVGGDDVTLTGGTATFDTKQVGTGKTVTGTGFALSGADALNYTLASSTLTTTANITARALTITATGVNKVYDGTVAATVNLADNRIAGDNLTTSFTSASFDNKNVGTAKPVAVSGLSISGPDAGNYTFNATASTTADITSRPLVVSATAQNKVYDGNANATVTLSDDRIAGDVFTTSFTTALFADKHAGNGKTVTVTGISISGTDAGNYTANATATATANITPRALLVTATGINKVYDGTTVATVTLSDDRIAGDVFTASYTGASFADKNAGTAKPVSVSGIALSGADAANYTPNTSANTTADITPRALLVSATGVNKVYDATTTATVTLSDNRVAGDVATLAYTGAAFADKNVGTAKPVSVSGISISGADAPNYTANTSASTTADITVATVTGSFTADSKVYDGTTAATIATRSLAGVLLTDVVNLAGGNATFADKNVGTGKTVTGTGFTLSGGDAGNYVLASTTLTTTADITPRALLVSATGINKIYDATTAATVTLSDNRVSGDILTTAYTAATFADKNVGAAKPVTVSGIAISGADALNYTANTTTSTTADITPATLTGSFTADSKVYDGTDVANIASRSVGGVLLADVVTLTGGTATFSDKNVGNGKTVTATGFTLSGADAGNYVLASTTLTTTANITQRPLTVSATGIDKVYDGNTTATVTLSDNRVSGDVVTLAYTGAAFADKNVGTAKPVSVSGISISGADAANYTFNTVAATTANITPRQLTVSATGVNKVYDGNTSATVTLSDDRVSGDVLTTAYGSAAFADKNVGTGKTVNVSGITISGTDAGNYTVNATTATTADITARVLTVVATGVNKVYDGTTTATVTLGDDRVVGDVLTTSYAAASFGDKNVGTAKPVSVTGISISGTDAGNYTVNTTANTTADITPRPVTVTADAQTKVYGSPDPALTYQVTSGSVVAGDAFAGALSRVAGENVGTYAIEQNTLALSTNYTLTYVGANLTITKAPLTVSFVNVSMNFGSAVVPAFTVAYAGFAFSDTPASLGGTLVFTPPHSSFNATSFAGVYNIAPSGLTSANYAITFMPGTFTIIDTTKPIVTNSLVNPNPVPLNTAITITARVSDATTGNSGISSACFAIDGGACIPMSAAPGYSFGQPTVNVTGSAAGYPNAGVHAICVYGTDAAGNIGTEMDGAVQYCVLLAVYDPSAGFVTGGGWITSPVGAYVANPVLTGKANFGFVSKYKKGATLPEGNTEFQFHAAGMNFKSTTYEWLVIAGARAQYKGSGTINGSGDYGFLLTGIDGQVNGGGGTDKFRIKIWLKSTGAIVYDNQMGESDTGEASTALSGGSIVIHSK